MKKGDWCPGGEVYDVEVSLRVISWIQKWHVELRENGDPGDRGRIDLCLGHGIPGV